MKVGKTFLNVAFLAVIGILIFQGYLLYDLKNDLNKEIKSLDNSLINLNNKVNSDKSELEEEISDLRNESAKAIRGLGGNIDTLIKENKESKKAIEQLSEGLEELENVQVQASKDFSSIVEDVIGSVVIVKAGNSFGSGVFVSPEYLITNYHVVKDNPDDVVIGTVNNKGYQADLIGYEPNIDLAVLYVKGGNFPFLEFENVENVKIGESVIAVG